VKHLLKKRWFSGFSTGNKTGFYVKRGKVFRLNTTNIVFIYIYQQQLPTYHRRRLYYYYYYYIFFPFENFKFLLRKQTMNEGNIPFVRLKKKIPTKKKLRGVFLKKDK